MGTFITAYAIVWLALVLYTVRLRARQRHLERIVRELSPDARESRAWPGAGAGV
jgi:CcmD family protein